MIGCIERTSQIYSNSCKWQIKAQGSNDVAVETLTVLTSALKNTIKKEALCISVGKSKNIGDFKIEKPY